MVRFVVCAILILATAGPAFAVESSWAICWQRKIAGVAADGTKTYCKSCQSKEMKSAKEKYKYNTEGDCVVLPTLKKAKEWYRRNCDCP